MLLIILFISCFSFVFSYPDGDGSSSSPSSSPSPSLCPGYNYTTAKGPKGTGGCEFQSLAIIHCLTESSNFTFVVDCPEKIELDKELKLHLKDKNMDEDFTIVPNPSCNEVNFEGSSDTKKKLECLVNYDDDTKITLNMLSISTEFNITASAGDENVFDVIANRI